MDYQKEIKRLGLELMSLKNSVSLIQAEPVLNNLPGSSINTPNLSTKEHSPYWGSFRCEINDHQYRRVKISPGKVFFGCDLVHDFPTEVAPGFVFDNPWVNSWGTDKVWIGLECRITSDPTDMTATATSVTPVTTLTPTQHSGAYYVWLAKVSIIENRAIYLEQRWQGSDIYVPLWFYCGDTDGGSFDCEDGTKETDVHTCKRVAQLGSPACNPGNHNHSVTVAAASYITDCWCEGT